MNIVVYADADTVALEAAKLIAKEAREAVAARPSSQGPQVEDPGEEGEQRTRTGIEHAEMQRHLEELREIDTAKARLDHGTYGECVDCGTTIAAERSIMIPTSDSGPTPRLRR